MVRFGADRVSAGKPSLGLCVELGIPAERRYFCTRCGTVEALPISGAVVGLSSDPSAHCQQHASFRFQS